MISPIADIPRRALFTSPLQESQVPLLGGCRAYSLVPGAALAAEPLQHVEVAANCSRSAHALALPNRRVRVREATCPKEHLQMPCTCCCLAGIHGQQVAFAVGPLEHFEPIGSSGGDGDASIGWKAKLTDCKLKCVQVATGCERLADCMVDGTGLRQVPTEACNGYGTSNPRSKPWSTIGRFWEAAENSSAKARSGEGKGESVVLVHLVDNATKFVLRQPLEEAGRHLNLQWPLCCHT